MIDELERAAMANHSTVSNINRMIRRHAYAAGYSAKQVSAGLAYAAEQGPYTAREGYILAMSRILYSDAQLEAGARFSLAEGFGPR